MWNAAPTRLCLAAERELLSVLRGHCHTPIAGHARLDGGGLELRAAVFSHDGGRVLTATQTSPASEAEALGAAVGGELLGRGARELIADAASHEA
ncbi:hypothetical protein AB0J52_40250 [Spirillospora sp. NPDC049652]